MKWSHNVAMCLASAAFLPSIAGAAVTVQFVNITPGPSATVQTLATNGWQCYLLVATADAGSKTVGGWDLSTPISTLNSPTSNKTGHDWGIFAGPGDAIAQRWAIDAGTLVPFPSNYGTPPVLATPISSTVATSPDSFFFSSGAYAQATAPSEDNNGQSGANPPYTQNPNASTAFNQFGVGTFMKAAGTVQSQAQVQTQVIAEIWIPANSLIFFHAYGAVTDSNAALFNFDAPAFAEPGSLALLGLGGLMLLKRRRGTVANTRDCSESVAGG